MGILLLLILSLFFGYCFTEHQNRRVEKLKLQLEAKNAEIVMLKFQNETEKALLKATIKELL